MKGLDFFTYFLLFEEFLSVTNNPDAEYDKRQNPGDVELNLFREFNSASCICFFKELIKAPAVTACTENKINKRAKRQQVFRNDKVFKTRNITDFWNLETAQYVEAQSTRKRKKQNQNQVHANSFFAAPAIDVDCI